MLITPSSPTETPRLTWQPLVCAQSTGCLYLHLPHFLFVFLGVHSFHEDMACFYAPFMPASAWPLVPFPGCTSGTIPGHIPSSH